MNDDYNEMSKLLFASFPPQFPKTSRSDLMRLWSLEMQWFNPNDANLVVSHLLDNNWIMESEEYLYPNSNVKLSSPMLGWRPILREILNSPPCTLDSIVLHQESEENAAKIENKLNFNQDGEDPKSIEDKTTFLINYVSRKSGLTNREVVRRSQRKRKALGPVTLWLCVALLAREQGLDMDKITKILEK